MAEANPSAQAQPEVQTLEANEFSSLLQREFKPKSDQAKEAVENAVKTLAEQALQYTPLISRDVIKSIGPPRVGFRTAAADCLPIDLAHV